MCVSFLEQVIDKLDFMLIQFFLCNEMVLFKQPDLNDIQKYIKYIQIL